MQDANSVITEATKGHVEKLANRREISLRRMYEQLGDQCVYPKAKLLIRDIAAVNPQGVQLIRADVNALFADVLADDAERIPTITELHQEAFEAVDALLKGKSAAEQKKELRELIAIAERLLEGVDSVESRSELKIA